MNIPIIVVLASWMASFMAWGWWRRRVEGPEGLPTWLRCVFTLAWFVTLWGGSRLALAFTSGTTGAFAQLWALLVFMAGFLGIFLLWHQSILGFFSKPLTSALDGGSARVEPKPFYSRALALRKRGEYEAAIEDIEGELARFPKDAQGWLLKAEIQAADLQQAQLAALTLIEFAKVAAPADRSTALFQQAEVELNRLKNPEAAHRTLQRIIQEFPESDVARIAQQRIAHLPTEAWLAGNPLGDRESLQVVQHDVKIGLTEDHGASMLAPDRSPEDIRQELVLLLVQNPDNDEAREKLARLYAAELDRPDLAHQELETLINSPGRPDRERIRWMNLLADFHLRRPDGIPDARLALQRILDQFPGSAAAEVASRRITLLKVEKGDADAPTLKLGEPTGNVGLATERRFSARRANLPGLLPEPEEPKE